MNEKVIVSSALVLVVFATLIIQFGVSTRKSLEKKYKIMDYEIGIFTYIQKVIFGCILDFISEVSGVLSLSDDELKPIFEERMGVKGAWTSKFFRHCVSKMSEELPESCALCATKNISQSVSPYFFFRLAKDADMTTEYGMGCRSNLALLIQLSIKNCDTCRV
jgi:hypothetical protein